MLFRSDRHHVERLRSLLPGPFTEIPFDFDKPDDSKLVRDMADYLHDTLTGPV